MKKVKTLYLHGLDSSPLPQKMEMLENAGFDVTAPFIDYRREQSVYQRMRALALEENIEFLAGSSLGGYVAFWLAEDLGLPCLLFNPAMSYSDQLSDFIPDIEIGSCPARFVVIGQWDEVVDPQKNIRFFREIEDDNCYHRLIICDWLAHEIDFPSFEELVNWAAAGYRVFKRIQTELR